MKMKNNEKLKMKNNERLKIKLFFFNLSRLISWILANEDSQGLCVGDFKPLLDKLERVFLSRGQKFGVTYVKILRVYFVNYISGEQKTTPFKLTHDRIPITLGDLIPKIRKAKTTLLVRLLMTIFFSTRSLKGKTQEDFSSITSSTNSSIECETLDIFIGDF